jgi:acyl transferase domain-containing protein
VELVVARTALARETGAAADAPMVAPAAALDVFRAAVIKVDRRPPTIPWMMSTAGTWLGEQQVMDAGFWVKQLQQAGRFSESLASMEGQELFCLEVGPGQALGRLAREALGGDRRVATTLRRPEEDASDLFAVTSAIAKLWSAGIEVDWERWHAGERRRRLPLPTYPFERRRYWVAPRKEADRSPATEARRPESEWCHLATWTQTPPAALLETKEGRAQNERRWLVFAAGDLELALVRALRQQGIPVTLVRPGEQFAERSPEELELNPIEPDHYLQLFSRFGEADAMPAVVVHAWSLLAPDGEGAAAWERAQDLGFYSLANLARALALKSLSQPMKLIVVTSGLHEITDDDRLRPENATTLGPSATIAQELPQVTCRSIDIDRRAPLEQTAALLLSEADAPLEPAIAFRGSHRFVRRFAEVDADPSPTGIRSQGVYMLVGGYGRVGRLLGDYLAEKAGASIVVVSRGLPSSADDASPQEYTRARVVARCEGRRDLRGGDEGGAGAVPRAVWAAGRRLLRGDGVP